MIRRFAYVVLVVTLVSAGGSAPFAHVHPQGSHHTALKPNTAPQPDEAPVGGQPGHRHQRQHHRQHHHGQGAHWHPTGRQAADGPATTTLVGNPHHHPSVAVSTVAVERLSGRGGRTLAPADVWESGTVPTPPGHPVPVAANARPNPPPRVLLSARAPPR